MINAEEKLRVFQEENNIFTKGPLSVVIQFTRMIRRKDFPLNSDDFKTEKEGQIAGLGGGNLKKILKDISRSNFLQRVDVQAEVVWG